MSEPLRLTIVYQDASDGDALRGLLAARFGSPPEPPDRTDSDSLELTVAA
ncbi:MAG: hypothetical protein ACXVE1_17135 [Gaiellaceae bacterium]